MKPSKINVQVCLFSIYRMVRRPPSQWNQMLNLQQQHLNNLQQGVNQISQIMNQMQQMLQVFMKAQQGNVTVNNATNVVNRVNAGMNQEGARQGRGQNVPPQLVVQQPVQQLVLQQVQKPIPQQDHQPGQQQVQPPQYTVVNSSRKRSKGDPTTITYRGNKRRGRLNKNKQQQSQKQQRDNPVCNRCNMRHAIFLLISNTIFEIMTNQHLKQKNKNKN